MDPKDAFLLTDFLLETHEIFALFESTNKCYMLQSMIKLMRACDGHNN